jgi:iron complex transport system permease protein
MKITLDLTTLVASGKLTAAEAERLKALSSAETGTMGTNILFAFGAVAVALGIGVLLPSVETVIALGVVMLLLGLALTLAREARWTVFAQIMTTIGALGVAGGILYLSNNTLWVSLALALGLCLAAGAAASGLLAALSVLLLAVALGSGTAYWHAMYFIGVPFPVLTIVVLGGLATALVPISKLLPPSLERVAIIAARTAVLLVNVAFLVGSLFGDPVVNWPPLVFTIAWAVLLIGVGIWGVLADRRWVVNTAAVFGAIHFYTQWFETLGAQPLSILGGGLLLIAFGFLLARFNNWIGRRRSAKTRQSI